MLQIFYVAQDEEILSIIGRFRTSRMLENVFVIPKRSLVLGSGVNLRLLAREAEKTGRRILIVTQDEEGRALAEKAGIPTKPYSEEFVRDGASGNRPVPSARQVRKEVSAPVADPEEEEEVGVPAESLGSDSFFSLEPSSPEPSKRVSDGLRIRIRDNTPKRMTSLNSMRRIPEPERESRHPASRPIPAHGVPERPAPRPQEPTPKGEGRLARIFRGDARSEPSSSRPANRRDVRQTPRRETQKDDGGGRGGSWFVFFAGISALFLSGTLAVIFLTKAIVDVVPKSASKSMEIAFEGKTSPAPGERELPVRVMEHGEEVSVTVQASGEPSSSGQKSQGAVTIYNEYGTEPQSLVATTRLETPDGKIFRITKGVTVPGMTEQGGTTKPGAVEVTVVADQTGSSYDIGPTTFTIPGFKGNPKYGKFYAKSTSAMTGGSVGGGEGAATVTEADIRKAAAVAEEEFRRRLEEKVLAASGEGERYVPESFGIITEGNPVHPETGFATVSFEYCATYSGKAFLFSEDALREKATAIIEAGTSFQERYSVQDITLEYLDEPADYDAGRFPIHVRATALFVAGIDQGGLRNDLLGKRMNDVRSVLDEHPEVDRVEISWPLPTALPRKVRQLEIRVLDPAA